MATVYVVMGNDFPAAVYSNEQDADARCREEMAKNEQRKSDGYGTIYWRYYDFPLLAPVA